MLIPSFSRARWRELFLTPAVEGKPYQNSVGAAAGSNGMTIGNDGWRPSSAFPMARTQQNR